MTFAFVFYVLPLRVISKNEKPKRNAIWVDIDGAAGWLIYSTEYFVYIIICKAKTNEKYSVLFPRLHLTEEILYFVLNNILPLEGFVSGRLNDCICCHVDAD